MFIYSLNHKSIDTIMYTTQYSIQYNDTRNARKATGTQYKTSKPPKRRPTRVCVFSIDFPCAPHCGLSRRTRRPQGKLQGKPTENI